MDPNATLRELREAITKANGTADTNEYRRQVATVLDRAEALDEWISGGGFLPDAWKREENAARDSLGNVTAREGYDRCYCGCKYWESDRCIDCGTRVSEVQDQDQD